MVRIMNRFIAGIKRYSVVLILIMSIFHIGIAYIHSWDSGRADFL